MSNSNWEHGSLSGLKLSMRWNLYINIKRKLSMKSLALYYSLTSHNDVAKKINNNIAIVVNNSATGKSTSIAGVKSEEKPTLPDKDLNTEFHLNIWKVEVGKLPMRPRFYFDFGIMFPKEYKQLCLYLPFDIEGRPKDLSGLVLQKTETLSAVFNEETSVWQNSSPNFYNVRFTEDEKRKFFFYKLSDMNFDVSEFVVDGMKEGIFLKVLINGEPGHEEPKDINSDYIYVRFRVLLAKGSSFIKTESISNDLLQAAFSSTDLIDIRVNESRVLHSKIKEHMALHTFKPCEFEKVHLFYMVDTRENVDNGSSLKQDTRIVEDEQWGEYIPATSLHNTTFVAYHWRKRRKYLDEEKTKKEDAFKSFNVFFSTIYPQANVPRLFAYLFVAVIIGFLGSMLTFHITQLYCNWWPSWIRPIVVVIMLLFVVGYFVRRNFGGKRFEIFRKR